MAGKIGDDTVRCSFCNKTQNQVRKLIAGQMAPTSVMSVLKFVLRLSKKNLNMKRETDSLILIF